MFEIITTVGYGDYSGGTSNEYMFSIFIEFVGLTFFSLLMGIMSNFFSKLDDGFESLLSTRMFECDLWIRRIEQARKGNYVSPELFVNITEYIEDAFKFDFNLLIEEGSPFFE